MNALQNFFLMILGPDGKATELTTLQISLRGLVIFVIGLAIVRIGDRRSLAEKTGFDAIFIVLVGSMLSRAINGPSPFFTTIGGAIALMIVHRAFAFGAFKSHGFGNRHSIRSSGAQRRHQLHQEKTVAASSPLCIRRWTFRVGRSTFSSMPSHDKLFIPGPVEVSAKTWAAFSRPMIGHRGEDFKNLYRNIHPKLQTLFATKQPVFLSTSSAWGVMEAAIRNLVRERVLCCMCGAFSDKWLDVARRCGKEAEPLQVDWGKHIDHREIDRLLAGGKFDAVTLIHNETSTGVMNPLPEICCLLAKYPEVALIVDTVSSFSAVQIEMDALGIDVMLTGAQKALALPPGFSLFSVSEKAFSRAEKQKDRGYYFDFLEFKKNQENDMTPSTPSIAHIHALQSKLDDIFAEGLTNRYERHAKTNALVHDWVRRAGFDLFAEDGFRSKTLTCVRNTRGIDVAKLVHDLRAKHHLIIDGGYGRIKSETFRLSNMGDETEETLSHLLACLDDSLA
ncbi:MAG: alanine--glyoxylate aminotransferase family protein [Verrucomicrobiaceae bacterium]|nr:alanine--glyoxylate aminotransferase family protein [Verrucomicrobiaceae bacterium]